MELLPAGTESTWMAMIRHRSLTSDTVDSSLELIASPYRNELHGLHQGLRRSAEKRPKL